MFFKKNFCAEKFLFYFLEMNRENPLQIMRVKTKMPDTSISWLFD